MECSAILRTIAGWTGGCWLVIAALVLAFGWVAVRRGWIDLSDKTKRGGGGGGVMMIGDEVFAPRKHEAQVELDRQSRLPVPAPVPGDGDKGIAFADEEEPADVAPRADRFKGSIRLDVEPLTQPAWSFDEVGHPSAAATSRIAAAAFGTVMRALPPTMCRPYASSSATNVMASCSSGSPAVKTPASRPAAKIPRVRLELAQVELLHELVVQRGVAREHVELVEQAHERVVGAARQARVDGGGESVAGVGEIGDRRIAIVAEPLDAGGMRLDQEGVEVLVVVEDRAAAETGLRRDIRQRQRPEPVCTPCGIRRFDERRAPCLLPFRSCHAVDTSRPSCNTA